MRARQELGVSLPRRVAVVLAAEMATVRDRLMQLGKEHVRVGEKVVAGSLTAACGIVSTADPATDAAAFVARADAEQKRAKEASRVPPRASFLAVEGRELERVSVEAD